MTTGTKQAFDPAALLVEIHGQVQVLMARTECIDKLKEDSDGMRKVLFGVNGTDGLLREIKSAFAQLVRDNKAEHEVLHRRIKEARALFATADSADTFKRGQWKGVALVIGALLAVATWLINIAVQLRSK